MTLRYGILSTSSIAPRFIAGVRAAQAGQIVALSSRSLEKAREKAALWGIPTAYASHDELLRDPQVNIVYISTVNALHFQWAQAALLAGKHVVCEKPCTTSQAQTRALFELARDRGLFFMEAEKMLFLPAVEELRRRILAGPSWPIPSPPPTTDGCLTGPPAAVLCCPAGFMPYSFCYLFSATSPT